MIDCRFDGAKIIKKVNSEKFNNFAVKTDQNGGKQSDERLCTDAIGMV